MRSRIQEKIIVITQHIILILVHLNLECTVDKYKFLTFRSHANPSTPFANITYGLSNLRPHKKAFSR